MLSRVADSLYWMSRYLERAEHTVRMLDVNMGLMLDKSATSAEGQVTTSDFSAQFDRALRPARGLHDPRIFPVLPKRRLLQLSARPYLPA